MQLLGARAARDGRAQHCGGVGAGGAAAAEGRVATCDSAPSVLHPACRLTAASLAPAFAAASLAMPAAPRAGSSAKYIPTDEDTADLFTKVLKRQPFEKHRKVVLNLPGQGTASA